MTSGGMDAPVDTRPEPPTAYPLDNPSDLRQRSRISWCSALGFLSGALDTTITITNRRVLIISMSLLSYIRSGTRDNGPREKVLHLLRSKIRLAKRVESRLWIHLARKLPGHPNEQLRLLSSNQRLSVGERDREGG